MKQSNILSPTLVTCLFKKNEITSFLGLIHSKRQKGETRREFVKKQDPEG